MSQHNPQTGSTIVVAVPERVSRCDAPRRRSCVMGDGGMLVHLSELAAAARYELPIGVLVCNKGGYKQVGDRRER